MTPTTAVRNIPTLETYSGKFLDLSDPQPKDICLADIAVGLANTCRFGGQVTRFYSVAEHSVRCADEAAWTGLELACLLHDAHEAYTGDLTAPLKHVLGDSVREIQNRLDAAISEALRVDPELFKSPFVKAIDDKLLFHEAAGLKYSHGIGEHWGNHDYLEPLTAFGWTPADAERRFIETYERLTNG